MAGLWDNGPTITNADAPFEASPDLNVLGISSGPVDFSAAYALNAILKEAINIKSDFI